MSMFGRRSVPADELPADNIPVHLRQHREPHPAQAPVAPPVREARRSDPLDPRAATLLSQAIIDAAQRYVDEIDQDIQRAESELGALRRNFEAWKATQLANARARAEDIAQAHADILQRRDRFFNGPAAPVDEAPSVVMTVPEAQERLENLAQRLEAVRPGSGTEHADAE